MTGSDEQGDGEDEAVDLDEPRPPSTTTDPVQDPIDWEAQSEDDPELDGELNEPRRPSTVTDPVQEPPDSVCAGCGENPSGDDECESGPDGDAA